MGDIEKFPSKSVEKRVRQQRGESMEEILKSTREQEDADAVERLLGGLGAVALVDRLLKPSDDH